MADSGVEGEGEGDFQVGSKVLAWNKNLLYEAKVKRKRNEKYFLFVFFGGEEGSVDFELKRLSNKKQKKEKFSFKFITLDGEIGTLKI